MQCNSQVFLFNIYQFSLFGCSFLFLLILLGVRFRACLGSQRAHGVTDGLVVWVDSRKVFQDTLKEFWILHNIVVLFILHKDNVATNLCQALLNLMKKWMH